MPLPNAYQQYANNKVMTASPAELTLMLYEGAIKFLNISLGAIEENDVQKAHTNILKAEHIIDYLRQTLDMKYAVAQDFENIYSYPEIIQEVNGHLHSVRDTWKEVMKINGITWRS